MVLVEVEKECNKELACFIFCVDDKLIFMMAIGSVLLEIGDEAEILLMVTIDSDKRLVDIHDQRPWILTL